MAIKILKMLGWLAEITLIALGVGRILFSMTTVPGGGAVNPVAGLFSTMPLSLSGFRPALVIVRCGQPKEVSEVEWTGARYADTPTAQVRIWIDAPPERVWQLVSDIESMPAMSQELQSVEWLDGASGPAVGARFAGRNKYPAVGEWTSTSEVIECQPERVFAWAVGDPADPTAVWRFRLAPDGAGTELSQWVQLGPGRSGLSVAIDRMPDKEQEIVFGRLREFERNMTNTLEHIKQRAEN